MKKFLCVILAAMLLVTYMAVPVLAESAIVPYNSNCFTSYGTTLSNKTGGVIKIIFSAEGTGICEEIGVVSFNIEKYDADDLAWEDVTELQDGKTGTDVSSYTYSIYFQGIVGERYRVNCIFVSRIDGVSEYKSYTSSSIVSKS